MGDNPAMIRLEVSPPLLSEGALRQQLAAQELARIAAELESAGQGAAAAAGAPGLAGAMSSCAIDGAADVRAMNVTLGGLAANLEAAAGLYALTDSSAMPGG